MKTRTQPKLIIINKTKDVNKRIKLSKVKAQGESGIILLNQAFTR